jgi:hydroxyacylglutathione hydrolase
MHSYKGKLDPSTDILQPGHEYTKGNVKFGIKVVQSEPIKELESFANSNKQTQGKFTIGDEKVSSGCEHGIRR